MILIAIGRYQDDNPLLGPEEKETRRCVESDKKGMREEESHLGKNAGTHACPTVYQHSTISFVLRQRSSSCYLDECYPISRLTAAYTSLFADFARNDVRQCSINYTQVNTSASFLAEHDVL